MLIDIVRHKLYPSEDYDYLMYSCESPRKGVNIHHVQTSDTRYEYAVINVDNTVKLSTTKYLAEKAVELSNNESYILKVHP